MKFALTLALLFLLFVAGCAESPVPSLPVSRPITALFYGDMLVRRGDGEYEKVESFYEASNGVSGRPHMFRKLLNDRPIAIGLVSAERDSAEIQVWYRDEKREVTVTRDLTARMDRATDVLFSDGNMKLSFSLAATTCAPLMRNDAILNAPAVAHRLDPAARSDTARSGHKVLATKHMTANQSQRVRAFLTENGYLELEGADCFDPGVEFQFGQGDNALHVVVCLSCCKMRFARTEPEELNLFLGVNKAGVAELKALYDDIF